MINKIKKIANKVFRVTYTLVMLYMVLWAFLIMYVADAFGRDDFYDAAVLTICEEAIIFYKATDQYDARMNQVIFGCRFGDLVDELRSYVVF